MSLRVAVVRFPGSNCDADTLHCALRVGDRGLFRLAPGHRPAGGGHGDPAGRIQLRRLPALRRDRPLQPDHAGGPGPRRGRRSGPRDLQRLPDPLRGRAPARRAGAQRQADLRLAADLAPGGADRHRLHHAYTPGALVRMPVAHGDGRFAADARHPATGSRREKRVVVRYVAAGGGPAGETTTPTARCATSPGSATSRATWWA